MRLTRLGSIRIAVVAVGIAGCGSGSSGPPPVKDAAVFDLALDLPPGCPPSAANNAGVGIPCTRGGGECTKTGVPGGLLCTCDGNPIIGAQLNVVACSCTGDGPNEGAATRD